MSDDRNEAMSQHDRDSRELRSLCAQRDAARETVRQQAERIAELEKEGASLKEVMSFGAWSEYLACKAERDQLRAEVERLRADAERWEYALNSEEFAVCERGTVFGEPCWVPISEESAIDHARTTHKDEG